jgi:putative endonuclease
MWPLPTLSLGRGGERLAARFLRRHGYRVLVRSYRCALGEIDLVARQNELVVFVEVKTRASNQFGEPWEAVTARKRRQVTRAAVHYLKAARLTHAPVRFDIVAITWQRRWFSRPDIQHFPAAFDAEGPWSV